MEFIQKVIEMSPIGVGIVVFYYLVKLIDKKIKNNELDDALTPSWQNLLEQIIITLIAAFIVSFIILSDMIIDFSANNNGEIIPIQFNEMVLPFSQIYILVTFYIGLLWVTTNILNSIFSGRKIFYTHVNNLDWEIEKAPSKNVLYLKHEERRLRHTYNGDIELFSELKQNKNIKKFYGFLGNVKYYRIIAFILYFVTIAINIYLYFFKNGLFIFAVLLSIIVMIVLFNFMFGFNLFVFENTQEQEQEQEQEHSH